MKENPDTATVDAELAGRLLPGLLASGKHLPVGPDDEALRGVVRVAFRLAAVCREFAADRRAELAAASAEQQELARWSQATAPSPLESDPIHLWKTLCQIAWQKEPAVLPWLSLVGAVRAMKSPKGPFIEALLSVQNSGAKKLAAFNGRDLPVQKFLSLWLPRLCGCPVAVFFRQSRRRGVDQPIFDSERPPGASLAEPESPRPSGTASTP